MTCNLKVIYGGPKVKWYCETCHKFFDTPTPICNEKNK